MPRPRARATPPVPSEPAGITQRTADIVFSLAAPARSIELERLFIAGTPAAPTDQRHNCCYSCTYLAQIDLDRPPRPDGRGGEDHAPRPGRAHLRLTCPQLVRPAYSLD